MRLFSSRSSLFARHAFVRHQYIGSLLFFEKIYLSAHMITVLKQNRSLIYLHNVCMSGALLRLHTQYVHVRRLKPSLLAFAIKIINSSAGSHDRSDFFYHNQP